MSYPLVYIQRMFDKCDNSIKNSVTELDYAESYGGIEVKLSIDKCLNDLGFNYYEIGVWHYGTKILECYTDENYNFYDKIYVAGWSSTDTRIIGSVLRCMGHNVKVSCRKGVMTVYNDNGIISYRH